MSELFMSVLHVLFPFLIFNDPLGYNLTTSAVYTFIIWIVLMIKMRKHKKMYLLFITLIIIYATMVIDATILPMPFNKAAIQSARMYPFVPLHSINLVPFFFEKFISPLELKFHLLNILMFVPMGIILSFYHESKFSKVLLKSFLWSLTIELVQLLLGILVSGTRIVDIDDLIMNTTGGVIGFLIFILIIKPVYRIMFKKEIYTLRENKFIEETELYL